MGWISDWIMRAIRLGMTMLFGSTGEIIVEKTGGLNLGTPGIMSIGGISGVIGAYFYVKSGAVFNPLIGILVTLIPCIVGSFLAAMIYGFLTVSLKANQNVTGLALTTFGTGFSNFIGSIINKNMGGEGTSAFPDFSKAYITKLPFADKAGFFGNIFLSYGFMTYLAIVIAIIVTVIIRRTRVGLNMRSIGENPATADAAGINVTKYQYFSIAIGGIISGMGGLYYVMDVAGGNWSNNILGQYGWLSVAIVIFAVWKPSIAIFGSALFGGLCTLGHYLPGDLIGNGGKKLFEILPYFVTVLVLVIVSVRKKRENQPPAHLGLSYFREDR